MPSLSKAIPPGGWMTVSSWLLYLGLINLIAIAPAVAQPAQPLRLADRTSSKPEPASEAATPSINAVDPANQADKTINATLPAEAASGQKATLVANGSSAPANSGGANLSAPATPPSAAVAVSSEQCLADCNPNERFAFSPPIPTVAIPPRSVYPRPDLAQYPAPYPSQPLQSGANVAQRPLPVPTAPVPTSGAVVPPSPGSIAETPTLTTSPPPLSSPNQTTGPSAIPSGAAPAPVANGRALTPPSAHLQGVYIYQGGDSSARVRATVVYPILPELQVGGSLDFTDGNLFSESGDTGLAINELYVAASVPNYSNLRFVVGQLDLTSYFDRNSFAKDAATQFFNPVFATNPALAAAGLGSRQAALVNWTITDNLEAKAAVFSSDRSISNFNVNGFAGELGARFGNLIVRGTYITDRDSGANTGFNEIFQIRRSDGAFGTRPGDREDAYGINAEYFIPNINLGLFARYGWYNNRSLDRGGTTYSFGINLLDLFLPDDRLGVAYGRLLSNSDLRGSTNPDVFEAFYDIRVLPWLRVGVTFQGLNQFSETIGGIRVRTDFDLISPRRSQ